MLPTEKASSLYKLTIDDNLYLGDNIVNKSHIRPNQHLYFLSNEEIKEGDWFINIDAIIDNNEENFSDILVLRASKYDANTIKNKKFTSCKKIIASTDKILSLPEPSQEFIVEFITEWNQGNKIEEVMVKYEAYHGINTSITEINSISGDGSMNWQGRGDYRDFKLDINPTNNTITIKQIKNIYSREEVINICKNLNDLTNKMSNNLGLNSYAFNKWIENNL